jgi:hypothetical protein
MSLGPDWNRLAIDRVYLNEFTVTAYQERAKLKNKHQALQDLVNDINQRIAESDQLLIMLETFHREHAKEPKASVV